MERPAPRDERSVAVAVLTFRRPEPLAALVPELVRQARLEGPRARVIVVDNDPAGGAEPAVRALALDEVTYVHEPRPGIAAGRNAALRAAADVDTLVFIDDDETPEADWLHTMLDAHRRLGGAAIAGPVLRIHEVVPPPWVKAARVMDRRRFPTGTPMDAAATGNLLLDLTHVRRHDLWFDDELGLAGGSDHLFTRQLRRSGGAIHWCDEAIVHERVPRERLTGPWTLRRGYRASSTGTRIELMLAGSRAGRARARLTSLVQGVARIALGSAKVLIGSVTRDPLRLGEGAYVAARGAGLVGGALGHGVVEYRRDGPSGSSGAGGTA